MLKQVATLFVLAAGFTAAQPATAVEFDGLKENQKIASFTVEAVYENEVNKTMGARFRHEPTRFVMDVLKIQSIPQAFMWVNSAPFSDQGEPHTLEHLLLGKGNRGRYVASLEEMSLGRSSAFTQQRRTCYHFSTEAGKDVFFNLFEAKLEAMISPNFSDEEIRREVCNMGLVENQDDGSLWLEEKGTVYNEMVSSFERPWGNLYRELQHMLFGPTHPLALDSGGYPPAIREMPPEDLRRFHADTHHLNNMGAVLSIGDDIPLEECLARMSEVLKRVEPNGTAGDDPAALWDRLPGPDAAPAGEVRLTHFPHQNENEPGLMVFAWPAVRDLDAQQLYMMELFMGLLASGQTSNLYGRFIDSQTRVMDLGANSAFYWTDEEPGLPLFVGFSSVNPTNCTEESIFEVRGLIMDEIRKLSALEAGSDDLKAFNERAMNQIIQDRRSLRKYLNSPPRFGYRGTGTAWLDHLQRLHRKGGFRRNLANVDEMALAEETVGRGGNPWTEVIRTARLLDQEPYAAATTAGPDVVAEEETAREQRIRSFVDGLKEEYGMTADADAVAAYRKDYEANTAAIEEVASRIEMPGFVDDPPLSLDNQLNFESAPLPGGGPLVASTFENMTGGTFGLALDMSVVPERSLMYVAALPTLIREIGVVHDGEPVSYNDFEETIRREILSLDAYYDVNYRSERVELVVRGAGSDQAETSRAVELMETVLFHSNLTPENLPRIRDAIDQDLKSSRNRMKGSEESWVNTPVYSFWKQHNPVLLNAECFLTQTHGLHRLRWQLKAMPEPPGPFMSFLDRFASLAGGADREAVTAALTAVIDKGDSDLVDFNAVDEATAALCVAAAEDLRQSLSEIPDVSLAEDMAYLCQQMGSDLAITPAAALARIAEVLDGIRHRDNVRAFVISSTADRVAIMPGIESIVNRLNDSPSTKQSYATTPRVTSRVQERGGYKGGPVFVALANENTRAGVHLHTADCASYLDSDPETLLRFLSARIYGGGGAHSMFMKTWGAGLAYSNGLRSNESRGRLIYYAERCPDLAQTLQFVVNELKSAPHDPTLGNYAVAQAFVGNRSGARYEQRGESMAADLADGLTPEVVARFRKAILELRKDPALYDKIHNLMEATYGEVLPGYGPDGAASMKNSNAIYFVIGPEKQLTSWEDYLRNVEPDARLTRMYPRDFWMTSPVSN